MLPHLFNPETCELVAVSDPDKYGKPWVLLEEGNLMTAVKSGKHHSEWKLRNGKIVVESSDREDDVRDDEDEAPTKPKKK